MPAVDPSPLPARRRVRIIGVAPSAEVVAPPTTPARLPYRADLLAARGFDVTTVEVRGTAIVERVSAALAAVRSSGGSVATVAVFESEGHALAALRSLVPRRMRRTPLVIVSCWLGELLARAPWWKRVLYRWIYHGADAVTVFSRNQVAMLVDGLAIAPGRVVAVPFGVDVDELDRIATSEDGSVVAIGRDRGRDWATFLAAANGSNWRVRISTRGRQLDGIDIPANVEMLGTTSRDDYLQILGRARVVAVITHDLAYPTGQTVLLEAMALGKACVVTTTPAMQEYLQSEVTCLAVAVGDVDGIRRAVDRLLSDAALRERLGAAARTAAHTRWTATAMWSAIGDEIDRVVR